MSTASTRRKPQEFIILFDFGVCFIDKNGTIRVYYEKIFCYEGKSKQGILSKRVGGRKPMLKADIGVLPNMAPERPRRSNLSEEGAPYKAQSYESRFNYREK